MFQKNHYNALHNYFTAWQLFLHAQAIETQISLKFKQGSNKFIMRDENCYITRPDNIVKLYHEFTI